MSRSADIQIWVGSNVDSLPGLCTTEYRACVQERIAEQMRAGECDFLRAGAQSYASTQSCICIVCIVCIVCILCVVELCIVFVVCVAVVV